MDARGSPGRREREPRDRIFTLVVHYRASDDRDESISLSALACFPQIPIFHAVGGCGRGGLNCGDSRRTIAIFSLRTATDRATGGAGSKLKRRAGRGAPDDGAGSFLSVNCGVSTDEAK